MYKSIRNSFFFLYTLLVFSFAFVFYFPVIVSAAQVTLEWDENSEEDLAGYRVFCRQEGHNYDYYNPIWQGTENTCTISGEAEESRYFFVVRAVNTSNMESGNSNEVYYDVGDNVELDRIEIEGPTIVNENSRARYACRAYYTNGSSKLVVPDIVEIDCLDIAEFSIAGILTTYEVYSNEICRIYATYAEDNIEETATYRITIKDTDTPEVIVDNGDAGTSSTGTWKLSNGPSPYGNSSLYSQEAKATYKFEAAVDGFHEVSVWWTTRWTRCASVDIEIYDDATWLDTVEVNQKINGGQWNMLGTYAFGGTGRVIIRSDGGCDACADAVMFALEE